MKTYTLQVGLRYVGHVQGNGIQDAMKSVDTEDKPIRVNTKKIFFEGQDIIVQPSIKKGENLKGKKLSQALKTALRG